MAITEIVLIGHSMGGLVIRSACHTASQHGLAWVEQVQRVFYLGTPHTGADLERFAHAATNMLQALPNPITAIVAKVLQLRSRGIKDLRMGTLLEPDRLETNQQQQIAWLPHAQHYLINGALTEDPEHAMTTLFGDGLVGVPAPMRIERMRASTSSVPNGTCSRATVNWAVSVYKSSQPARRRPRGRPVWSWRSANSDSDGDFRDDVLGLHPSYSDGL